jgi:iron complex outermembrane receptor protein
MRSVKLAASGVSALALMWALSPVAAFAETAAAPTAVAAADVNEVVVTTRRASENLEKVPLAISVTTADQMETRGITDLEGVAQYTPDFSFKEYITVFHGNPTVRAMTQVNTTSAVTNVGVFYDGVYLQRDFQETQDLGDFQQVDIVKGPQTTLYGANTFAGAINYVTRAPTDDFAGNALATYGNAGEKRFEGAVGGPIIKGILDGRIYAGTDDYTGTLKNNAPGLDGNDRYFGGHHRTAESVSLKFTPTDYLMFDAVYTTTHRDEQIRPYYTISGKFTEQMTSLTGTQCGVINAATNRGQLFCGQFPTDPTAYRTAQGKAVEPPGLFSNVDPDTLIDNEILKIGAQWIISPSLTAHYTFGATRGGASEDDAFFANTYNPTVQYSPAQLSGATPCLQPSQAGYTAVGCTPSASNTFNQQYEGARLNYTSHEIRLNYDSGSPFKAELDYLHSNTADHYFLGLQAVTMTGGVLPPLKRPSNDPLFAPPGTIFLNNLSETFKTDSIAARASYAFLDNKATVAAEFRYTITNLNFIDLNYLITHPTAAPLTASYNDPVPRFTAQYQLTPTNLIYASAAEGIKTGGFNGYASGTLTLLPADQSFGEEKNWTYELGAKNSFFNHTLQVNADVFYIDWFQKLAQLTPTNLPPQTAGANTTVATIYKLGGGAKNYGLEADITYKPIPPLTLGVSGAAQDPTYNSGSVNTSFIGYCTVGSCSVTGNIGGHQIERESRYSATVTGEYKDHLAADWDYFGSAEMTYQSMQYTDQMNIASIAPITLVNGQIGVSNDRWKAFFWGKNIFNTIYVADAFYIQSQAQYTASLGEGRTFGVTLAGKF